jgi:hypothetical protein
MDPAWRHIERMLRTVMTASSTCRHDRPARDARPRVPGAWLTWWGIGAAAFVLLPAPAALRSIWLAPLLEEVVLRLGVHDPLRRCLRGRFASAAPVIAALAFAASHLLFARHGAQFVQAAATAIPAWWIGLRYERGGLLLGPCVAWHAAFNLAWLCGLGAFFSRVAGA